MTEHASNGATTPGPLLEPAAELSAAQRERAARQMILPGFGEVSQRRLAAARVLVIGAGGLGSASVPYLVGAGTGTIGIVDDDEVELSNLHRQVAHRTRDVGERKVQSLARSASELDPGVRIVEHDLRLTAENALEIFRDYDLVVDGSDNFPTRYLANDAAEISGIPLVWGAILAHHGQVGVAWHRHGPGYRDLFPVPPAPEEAVSCEVGGVLPGLCGTVGSLLATEALKVITGLGEPLIGRVLVYDAMRARTRELEYAKDPAARPVRELIDYERFCAAPSGPPAVTAEELARLIGASEPTHLLDVRREDEREVVRIDPSVAVPLQRLTADIDMIAGLRDAGTPITVYCAHGPRSVYAARVLREQGIDARYLSGGIEAFSRTAPDLTTRGAR